MVALAAERGGTPDDPRQRNPLDFVLWQPSAADEPSWEAPWGPGRPGWHIECSAMAAGLLGGAIDVHGGGSDLIFPHHECEMAQSEAAAGGAVFVRHWMHCGMVAYEGTKMSKSFGNLVFVSDLCKESPARRGATGADGSPLPRRLGVARRRHCRSRGAARQAQRCRGAGARGGVGFAGAG